jgi:hypothetical protein
MTHRWSSAFSMSGRLRKCVIYGNRDVWRIYQQFLQDEGADAFFWLSPTVLLEELRAVWRESLGVSIIRFAIVFD